MFAFREVVIFFENIIYFLGLYKKIISILIFEVLVDLSLIYVTIIPDTTKYLSILKHFKFNSILENFFSIECRRKLHTTIEVDGQSEMVY